VSSDPRADLLLPEGTRLLHIGPQKTGTTGIQVAMHRSRALLREHGVVYPGKGTRPRKAVWSLLGSPEGIAEQPIKHWHRLVREVEAAGDARVCLSTEDWARTDLEGATRTVEGLGGDRVHVVASARRLDRLLPSQWQQRVKMRRITLSYEEWLEVVLGQGQEHPAWRNIWIPHDIEGVAERWAKAAGGPERFTLVIADETDRELLPRTFEQMLGLPSGLLSAAVTDVRNQSIGYGRTETIRHLTDAFERHGWRESEELETLLSRITDAVKANDPWPDEMKIPPLPEWAAARVRELSEQRVHAARSLGVRVVGDPESLRVPDAMPTSASLDHTVMVSSELAARSAETAIGQLLEQHVAREQQLRVRLRRLRRKVDQANGAKALETLGGRELLQLAARRGLSRLRRR